MITWRQLLTRNITLRGRTALVLHQSGFATTSIMRKVTPALKIRQTRQNGLKVLTIDGEADIRVGVVSALFSLLDMMRRAAHDCPDLAASTTSSSNNPPEALPCKCFDLIVGSGDGGWIAIMLGRLGMSTSQAIKNYLQIRKSVHDSYPYDAPLEEWQATSKASTFEALLQQLVVNQVESENADEMLQIPNPSCYVLALAMHRESDAPHAAYFRNYHARSGNVDNCPTWFAMRAAASSSIFPAAQIGSSGQRFLAASELSFNNPVDAAITEALSIAKDIGIPRSTIACLVSLGAGHPGVEALNESELGKTTIRLAQDAARAHDQALQRLTDIENLSPAMYFRLNVEQGLQKDLLHGISQGTIRTHTEMYLRKVEVGQSIDHVVRLVVGNATRRGGPLASLLYGDMTVYLDEDLEATEHRVSPLLAQDATSDAELMHVYAHELYPLGYGLPMWDPQPFQKVVDVGDLGFVNQHGSFETLFNITVPAKQQKYSLPPGFQPFSLSRINTLSQSINKPYLSSGIQVVEDGPECSQINWVIRHGAILIIKDLPTKLFIHHSRPLLKYIEANQSDWYEFLENHKDCPVDVLDGSKLLLVTGIHRNSDWSLGAWTGAIAQRSLSYTRHTADTATIGWNPNPAPGTRDGPAPRTQLYGPLHDLPNKNLGMESLFLEGFRISRRDRRHQDLRTGIRVDASSTSQAGWWDWLLGSKGVHSSSNEPQGPTPPTTSLPPPPPPAGHSSANSGNNIQIVGDISLPRHPLDDFIDLLFSVLPNIQTTIVHDSDLLELKRISHKYGPNSNHLFDNLVQSGSCAFFGFSSLDFPLHDLGPIIADAAARLDIATAQSLTLTSKQLHRVCNPILYQSVHLSTSESLDRFIETISSSPDVAQHVHHFVTEQDSISPSTDWFAHCCNLSSVAIFSLCHDAQGPKLHLPPSVTSLACDPQFFTTVNAILGSPDSTFQTITHLHLLINLPVTQFWAWLGCAQMPMLTHLAVEHHMATSLEQTSQKLTPLVQNHLHAHIQLCIILVYNQSLLLSGLGRKTIDLSDGSVDDRVVLGTDSEAMSSTPLGFLLRVYRNQLISSWQGSSSKLWVRAAKMRERRSIAGRLPLEYYSGGDTPPVSGAFQSFTAPPLA